MIGRTDVTFDDLMDILFERSEIEEDLEIDEEVFEEIYDLQERGCSE